ncbi:AP-3 complex subunit delta [Penicillium capsulatum]|uniref:AP-3 complex subunit delta n=1 Tax=Penicillium capsulatum TaxID=69766 RepID=A0A9W9HSQ4_9EURO|nr:AP-3 complex subunit delta [Penicillium capsulatum]
MSIEMRGEMRDVEIFSPRRFEKSLYDLIKGLRNHKGGEDEYIQDCLRECKAEIKSQDMDKKATALLKLIYLEMFGYDMSWASFHVLEVMSSPKYLQKRVGYLGAVQSFRPDTEVLMLATNMLKKDIISPNIPALSLPLATLPHIITPSLALSLLPDILSRLSHSSAVVRKKSIVCLYRLALVYSEALRLAWPKIQEHLMDEEEDPSVTSAAINVVCELGWRRPHDLLPLAPRLFELLVDSGNNWMAIKIIKLFATLTPLEPRLTRKLLRPLTNIIQTTTAMSLLYECINGIIQGGILDGEENLQERDEVASLCVGKLRGMIVMDSDPNRKPPGDLFSMVLTEELVKYVALLALNRIVATHPLLVSMQQDVIMDCLDDPDVSIRLQALELAAGMVTSDTIEMVVGRLLEQLRLGSLGDSHGPEQVSTHHSTETSEDQTESNDGTDAISMPSDYRNEVIHRVLDICSQNNYSDLVDFDWYVSILVQLVSLLPPLEIDDTWNQPHMGQDSPLQLRATAAFRIGSEIRNVAVRVKGVRQEATRAAESLLLIDNRVIMFPTGSARGNDILGPIAWIVGEFAEYLVSPTRTLQSLIDPSNATLPPSTLQLFLQAIPKVFVQLNHSGNSRSSWRSETSLLLARVVEFLETLAAHPDLNVQERAIEFLEVLRLGAEALQTESQEIPALITSVIPSLFMGLELNPVAASAQKKVILPHSLRLEEPFHNDLSTLFYEIDKSPLDTGKHRHMQEFYHTPDVALPSTKPFRHTSRVDTQPDTSYQTPLGDPVDDRAMTDRLKAERRERYRDDPFYIAPVESFPGTSTPRDVHGLAPGDSLDIDSIPIIDLKLDGEPGADSVPRKGRRFRPGKFEVTTDETFGSEEPLQDHATRAAGGPTVARRSLLQVDSSGLGYNSPTPGDGRGHISVADEGDAEMRKAMQNVEQVRLSMQRASERIGLEGIPAEGTLVKKKKKSKKHAASRASDAGQFKGRKKKETGS